MIRTTAVLSCLLIYKIFLAISAQPSVQNSRPALKIRDTLPFVKENSVIYVLQFDPDYLEFSDHSKGSLILDEFSDGMFTRDSANLDLQGMHFNSRKLIGLAVLGRSPSGALLNASGSMCALPWYDLSMNYPSALRCELRLAEIFVIIAELQGGLNLKDLTISSQWGNFSLHRPDRFSHSLLALLYNETGLDTAHVICIDCNRTADVQVSTLSCTEIAPKSEAQCLGAINEKYMESLSLAGHCVLIRWPEEFSVGSPFHNSSYAPLNELKCQGGSPADVLISRSLYTLEGKYPLYADVIVQSRSEPMHVITAEESVLTLDGAKDPYIIPFDLQVWAMLVATVLVTSLVIPLTTRHHPQSMIQFLKGAVCVLVGTLCIFLEQVTQYMSGGKSAARRVALLSLLLPSVLLTNHYRSALQSEFTITSEAHLNLTSIEELAGFKVIILVNGSKCQEFHELLLKDPGHDFQPGYGACANGIQEYDECTLVQQAALAGRFPLSTYEDNGKAGKPSIWRRMENMNEIRKQLTMECIEDIPRIVMETADNRFSTPHVKTAFITSEANFGVAWKGFAALMKEFPGMKRFGSKRDAEDSYFIGINGMQLSLRLASHQEWVRRKLRGTIESGIQYLWERWERWRGRRENAKQWDKFVRDLQEPKRISLKNSWILGVVYMIPVAAGLSSLVFCLEFLLFNVSAFMRGAWLSAG